MTNKEKLEEIIQFDIIQAIEDGFNGHDIKRDTVLNDVKWLIEQAEKVERYEKALKEIRKTSVYYDNKGWALNPDKICNNALKALEE